MIAFQHHRQDGSLVVCIQHFINLIVEHDVLKVLTRFAAGDEAVEVICFNHSRVIEDTPDISWATVIGSSAFGQVATERCQQPREVKRAVTDVAAHSEGAGCRFIQKFS